MKFAITYENLLQCLINFSYFNRAAKIAVLNTSRAVIEDPRVVGHRPDVGSDKRARILDTRDNKVSGEL